MGLKRKLLELVADQLVSRVMVTIEEAADDVGALSNLDFEKEDAFSKLIREDLVNDALRKCIKNDVLVTLGELL